MRKNIWFDTALISILTFVLLIPVLGFGFVNLDDNFYVTRNLYIRHLSASNILYFFTSFHHGVYAPLQYLTYMLVYSAAGYHALWYHVIGILWYAATGTMVYLLVSRIQHSRVVAFFSALLFLFSPVNIDSAAWVAELKNTQSLFFFLVSFYCYLLFRESGQGKSQGAGLTGPADSTAISGAAHTPSAAQNTWMYVCSLLAFVAGLLVKPPGATLLFMMFVYDRMSRHSTRDSLKKLFPYIAITIPFMVAYMIGQATIGSYHGLIRGSVWSQIKTIVSVAAGIFNYPLKLIVPFNLSVAYPLDARISAAVFVSGIAVLVLMAAGIRLLLKRNDRRPAFWALWYFVNMLPYFGIIAMPFFANWYLYIPSIGLYTLLVIAIDSIPGRTLARGVLVVVVILFGVLGFERQFVWRSDQSLWESSLNSAGSDSYIVRNLAISYFRNNENARGIEAGNELLRKTPDFVMMKYLIGKGYAGMQEYARAQEVLNEALDQLAALEKTGNAGAAVMPGLGNTPAELTAMIYTELADIRLSLHQPDAALPLYIKATTAAPYVPAYDKLAYLYVRSGRIADAKAALDTVTALKPDDPEPWRMLGFVMAQYYGNRALAAAYFRKSLALNPGQADAGEMRAQIRAWETAGAPGKP